MSRAAYIDLINVYRRRMDAGIVGRMETIVRDLMTSPAVTCAAEDTLTAAARAMQRADTGSVVVTDDGKVAGILTERDLLRAAAAGGDPDHEKVRLWMTARPDVLGPDERVDAAWASLTSHHYRHLPVVEGGLCVGVVSLRDLMGVARIRPATETSADVPAGPRGRRRGRDDGRRRAGPGGLLPLPPVLRRRSRREPLARGRVAPALPGRAPRRRDLRGVRRRRYAAAGPCRRACAPCCRRWRSVGAPLDVLRTAVVAARCGAGLAADARHRRRRTGGRRPGLCAVVPTILAAAHRLRQGLEPVEPRADLGFAANYLYMLTGAEPSELHARAIEQYMMLTIDHGFNASTFTARVVTSTGADLGCGDRGRHRRALGTAARRRAEPRARHARRHRHARTGRRPTSAQAVESGERIMGFGHRVYKTDDPRSLLLRSVTEQPGRAAGRVLPVGRAHDGRRAGRAQAGAAALHQRRVLRRRRHAHLRHPARDVHPDLRRPAVPSAGAPT